MSVAESLSDIVSLARFVGDVCLVTAIIGCTFTIVACFCILRFPVGDPMEPAALPPVTVLKPLHVSEPGLPARLAALCQQDYSAPVQILCGAQRRDLQTVMVVHELEADSADRAVELVVDPRNHGVNRKVSNLINMMPSARHDTLVLSDSDILVGQRYLRAVVTLLALPRVGAVTCLYHGIGGEGLWSRLSALAVNSRFLPQAITAISLDLARPCCGATIALHRSMLERIGGFGSLANVLADDHAIGVAVRAEGYDVVAAPFLVGHYCFEDSLHQLLQHQTRVARTIKNIDPIAYAGTVITHPLPLALLGMVLGSPSAVMVLAASLVARAMLCLCIQWRFDLPRQDYWLIPLQDVIAFAIYVTSFFGATVHWRGADYRVTAAGTLIEGRDLSGT